MSLETKFISREINELMWKNGSTLSTAESCTAGNVAAAITSVPGSSQFYKGGVVGYSNEVKDNMWHVSHETLETYGAVSEETITEMIKGAMNTLKTDFAVATSGIAGPGGGSAEKPVGRIKFCLVKIHVIFPLRRSCPSFLKHGALLTGAFHCFSLRR